MKNTSANGVTAIVTKERVSAVADEELHELVHTLIQDPHLEENLGPSAQEILLERCTGLAKRAFASEDRDAQLAAHRVLYVICAAHLSTPWDKPAVHVMHPLFANIRHALNSKWEQGERARNARILADMPAVEDVETWVRELVRSHRSNVTHPLFSFLRHEATLTQVREFFFQETPLEVWFGDIIASMLPGVYGAPKLEIAGNFWDEVGRGQDHRIHRNMRMEMMRTFSIPTDAHLTQYQHLVVEELRLINSYLTMATDRGKFGQLVGMLLATENMIPGRFEHQIEGMRRLGLTDEQMGYMLEHTTVDEAHAHGWLQNVVRPVLTQNPNLVAEMVFGVLRRLDAAGAVCDVMLSHLAEFRDERRLSFEQAAPQAA